MAKHVNELLAERAKVVEQQREILDEAGNQKSTSQREDRYQELEKEFRKLDTELREHDLETARDPRPL